MGPRIARYMTPCPETIGAKEPLAVAHEVMRSFGIRHLPVVEGRELVGVISQRDLYFIETLKGANPTEVSVEEAMTPSPFVVDPEASLARVVREMATQRYGCAMVVERGVVVGVFTTTDALRVLDNLLTERDRSTPRTPASPAARRRART